VTGLDERGRIELLRRIFAAERPALASPGVLLGIGDDAAVVAPSDQPLVISIDACVEHVHFRRELLSLDDLGYRATTAALSDLAAMGAEPVGVVAGLVLPTWLDDQGLAALASGQRRAVDAVGTAMVGGNLARGGELSITTTVLGRTPRPLRRDGARAGDVVWIAGPVGFAAAGLALLSQGGAGWTPADDDRPGHAAVAAWRSPHARIEEGLRARDRATAAIDVSDGLARDVGHVARASGVRIVLDAAALVSPELDDLARRLGQNALEWILHGGEDYALVVTSPAGTLLDGFARIGAVAEATGEPDVVRALPDGSVVPIAERGFDHFR
jgi:thiamine-monophosphate kinase